MALHLSDNIRKCKLDNVRENHKLQRHIQTISVRETTSLLKMDRHRISLMQELHVSRCKELYKGIRKALNVDEGLTIMRHEPAVTPPPKRRPDIFERSRGFLKIKIDDNDDDKYFFHGVQSVQRSNTLPDLRITYEDSSPKLRGNDFYLHCQSNENWKINDGIETVEACNRETSHSEDASVVARNNHKQSRPKKTVACVKNSNPFDICEHDHLTDGAMHLRERQYLQKRRERLPLPVGHLPVRRRKTNVHYYSSSSHNTEATNHHSNQQTLRFPQIHTNAALAQNNKAFLPKSHKEANRAKEEKEEQRRFHKLKQANEVEFYLAAIERTATFLGRKSSFSKLVPGKTLNREESAMLHHLQRSPSFHKQSNNVVN